MPSEFDKSAIFTTPSQDGKPAVADHAAFAIVIVAGDEVAHGELELLDFHCDFNCGESRG